MFEAYINCVFFGVIFFGVISSGSRNKISVRPPFAEMAKKNLRVRLHEAVRAGRARSKKSQDVFAREAGISRAVLVRLERAPSDQVKPPDPRLTTLDGLAKALQVDVCMLLGDKPEKPYPYGDQESIVRVASNVYRLRKLKGLSQDDLSEQSGHFRTYIHRLERLQFIPRLSDVEGIAKVLGGSVTELFEQIPATEYAERVQDRAARLVANEDSESA